MKRFIDYDGTLVYTMHEWVDWINERAGTSFSMRDVLSWDWVEKIQSELDFNVFSFFDEAEPYKIKQSSLQPIIGSLDFLRECDKLSDKYPTKILTATHDDALEKQKDLHIEHHFPGIEVIHEKDKHKYAINQIDNEPCFLLDDKASGCEEWVKAGGYAMLYTHNGEYPYAKTDITHPRMKVVDTYDEALSFMKDVMKSKNSNNISSTLETENMQEASVKNAIIKQ